MTTLPPLTTKQQEILKLIYRYRFLSRTQVQALLGHKDKRRIISWLKDLRDKEYVDWHYDATNFITKSKPAIFYLSLNGIRYLREFGEYPAEELQKRYKEPGRSQVFIDRCLLIADCCIALQAKADDQINYPYLLPSDYVSPGNTYHFLHELKPHLFFSKQQGNEATNYMLENFEPTHPRYQLRKRLKDVIAYLAENWDEDNGPTPVALLVCANMPDFMYVKRRITQLIGEIDGRRELHIRLTLVDKIRATGITSMIWEEV
jgi:hypothetical protein